MQHKFANIEIKGPILKVEQKKKRAWGGDNAYPNAGSKSN